MGFRLDARIQPSQVAFSTTSTTLATLTIPAVSGQRVCVTGYSVWYGTAFTTAVQPHLLDGASQLVVLANTLTTAAGTFPNAICGSLGNSVTLRTTVSTVSVVNMSLLYYYD